MLFIILLSASTVNYHGLISLWRILALVQRDASRLFLHAINQIGYLKEIQQRTVI